MFATEHDALEVSIIDVLEIVFFVCIMHFILKITNWPYCLLSQFMSTCYMVRQDSLPW